jgi:protein involved in temperature-dependent protein secretion
MNDAKLALDKGDLTGAVEAALRLVKTNPTDTAARIFLFELSCLRAIGNEPKSSSTLSATKTSMR